MLKKRILASSLASVMALSSVSAVAFADETVTSDIKTEVVSKAQLKEYVKSFEDFVDEKLDDYGEIQSEWFMNALDAAQAVVDSRFSTDEEITAAYQMLKAVYNKLQMYTQAELAELVAECKADYETDNEYNKTFGDLIWKDDKGQFSNDFVDAYEHAEDYLDSDDSADLNDAYLDLERTHDALSSLATVSKSDFRKAYNAYIELLDKFSEYEDWRRGTCSVASTTTTYKDARGNKIDLSAASYVTFGELKNIIYGSSDVALWGDTENGRDRGVTDPATTANKTWIEKKKVGGAVSVNATVQGYIKEAYEYFITNADSNVTTDDAIVKAYKAAVDAVKIFNGWEATTVRGSSARVMNDLLTDYRDNFIKDGFADDFVTSINTGSLFTYNASKCELKVAAGKETAVGALKINKNTGTFAYDENYTYEETEADIIDKGKTPQIVTLSEYLGGKEIKEDDNMMKYVPMTYQMVGAGAAQNITDAAGAVSDAEDVLSNAATVKATFKSTADEAALNSANLAENTAQADFNTAVGNITTYYNAVTGAMTSATNIAKTQAYNDAVDAVPSAPSAASTSASGQEAADAATYLTKVLAVVTEARSIVSEAEEAAQATVDAGSENVKAWNGQLVLAMNLYDACITNEGREKDDKRFDDAVDAIDDNNTIGKTDTKDAYALLVKYTTFALDNVYPGAAASKTLSEITDLCKKAADLIEETGDAAFGNLKVYNALLVEARKAAIEWVAVARTTNGYEDGDLISSNEATSHFILSNANYVYNTVNAYYDALKTEFAEYPYSYGDIAETLAEVAEGVDAGVYGASTDSIKAAAADVAYTLSTFDSVSEEDNIVFDDDRNFMASNRLREKGNGVTDAEKAFTKKYKALLAAIEEATKEPETPEVVKGDLTGDGVATPEDAIMIVKAFVGEITLSDAQKAAADFNGDGVVNADDALAVVKAYVGL